MVLVTLLTLVALVGCGRADAATVVEGQLRSGDLDHWLVGTTLVAIGEAQISGEPSRIGSRVRAEGRGREDGVFAATRITVGAAESLPASLPAAKVSGAVESIDPTTGRGSIAGQMVQFAPGQWLPANVAAGARVEVEGYTLPDGTLLIATVVAAQTTPTATPAIPAATATTPPPPTATIAPPPPEPTDEPRKPKPTKRRGNDDADDN